MVESDSGDILSPKNEPTTIAPQVIGTGIPRPMPTPSSATPAVASVPQLVPETTDIIVQIRQVTSRKIFGLMELETPVHHHRNGAAGHPDANEDASLKQNDDGSTHAFDAGGNFRFDIGPLHALDDGEAGYYGS